MKIPKYCPLCGSNLRYSDGDCMWDNAYFCQSRKHKNYVFTCEANSLTYIEIHERKQDLYLRWTMKRYGDIHPNTLTLGTNYSPSRNEVINWDYSSPLMDKLKEVIKKIEIQEVFS